MVLVLIGAGLITLAVLYGRQAVERLGFIRSAAGIDSPARDRAPLDPLDGTVDSLVAKRAADLETELRAEMERDLEAMRQKLGAAQRAAEVREQRSQRAERPADTLVRPATPASEEIPATAGGRRPPLPDRRPPRPAWRNAPSAAGAPARPPVRRALPRVGSQASRAASSPRLMSNLTPRFPPQVADDHRAQVLVPVRVWIDEQGRVSHAALKRPTEPIFDNEALRVAHRAAFIPATEAGAPVTSMVTLLVHFRR